MTTGHELLFFQPRELLQGLSVIHRRKAPGVVGGGLSSPARTVQRWRRRPREVGLSSFGGPPGERTGHEFLRLLWTALIAAAEFRQQCESDEMRYNVREDWRRGWNRRRMGGRWGLGTGEFEGQLERYHEGKQWGQSGPSTAWLRMPHFTRWQYILVEETVRNRETIKWL